MFSLFKKKAEAEPVQPGTVRMHYHVWGQVQHVGFRFTASQTGLRLGLTGWVRNNPDGTVEMEAQGCPERLRELMTVLQEDRYIRVEGYDAENVKPVPGEKGFRSAY